MPSKKGQKSKSKKKAGIPSTPPPPQELLDAVYQAQGWEAVADVLCSWLKIPASDLDGRHGLKQVHKNFDDAALKLDQLYKFALWAENDRVLGGTIGIYTKMSADSILRNRIFKEAGKLYYLNKLMALLDRPASRSVALESLAQVTHHGGFEVRAAIARKIPTLLDTLDADPENLRAASYVWTVISHSAASIVQNEEPPSPEDLRQLQVPRLLRSALFYIRKPNTSHTLRDHVLEFLSGASQHCYKDFWADGHAIDFLLSCTRNKDIRIRAEGLAGIMRACISLGEVEQIRYDPNKMMDSIGRPWPDRVSEILVNYGADQSDTYLSLQGTKLFVDAMKTLVRDHNYIKCGRRVAELILKTEHSIAQGGWQVENTRTGKLEMDNMGLPFTMWHEALPACARELRKSGNAKDLDDADILELKYLIIEQRTDEARAIAVRSVERSPTIGFFYYILTLIGHGKPEGLRDAKKGLKCPNLTGYVKHGLLFRATEHACDSALRKLQDASHDPQQLHEGYAFAVSAWEDSKAFIHHAPPDGRSMLSVCYLHTLMTVLLYGHEQTPDLPRLKRTKDVMEVAELAMRHLGRPVSKTSTRMAALTFYERLEKASQAWDEVTARLNDRVLPGGELDEDKVEDSLAQWLERFDMTDVDNRGHAIHEHRGLHSTINMSEVDLYRCSWCGNPSAILRKCRGCGKTRYCDGACQKQHWSASHRKVCARLHEQEIHKGSQTT
ncbi:hypothetical protein PENSPDRAFT_640910 [Peniophora sp. CONT]|nr:hypothetical protein PENSPDRAFT_640910 [Peniophora sp. CONT]